ncbi:MAG TPA: bifunctional alpha,alpha-trehalose-phosphate synthase (UDP-forming)/trehalose-phosphatase [Candidatus Saccharimonadales bacterium]|nr:bifunctional alpha,alpha-trehalose-phosphate synthase (UDP-forming)/trehalose-phosphatase [Candidatus Saccharimonadales bacterium]
MTTKVIIVSNRLPVSVRKEKGNLIFSSSIGGLATGLSSYISGKKSSLWVGWPGIPSEELNSKDKQLITDRFALEGLVPVWLSAKQIEDFYNGYSNSLLWPIFHGLSFEAAHTTKTESWWRAYKSVNRRYSEAVLNVISPNAQIWIHDYQLMLLPELIRRDHARTHIGFFLHIPFPEAGQLKLLPQATDILNGMMGADLIGFHTLGYAANFLQSVETFKLGELAGSQIIGKGRTIRVANFPMGIDYAKYNSSAQLEEVRRVAREYSRKYRRQKIIASVDRLDPTKGLMERLVAYESYLQNNPKSLGRVVFVMVAAPSRTDISDYMKLGQELAKRVKIINRKYSTKKWSAVEYINKPIPFEHVTALFQIADVAFITPIKDGMNLAAKEFVASNRKNGVLILSSSAGAAEELQDAIIVDPTNPEALTEAINKALHMRKRELKRRLNNMRQYLSTHTVQDWAQTFIDTLNQPVPRTPHLTYTLNERLTKKLIKQYHMSTKRLLIMDYDGSLSPYTANFSDAKPSKDLVGLIRKLASQPMNEIVIISGRRSSELEKWFGKLDISMVSEHGATIRRRGQANWEKMTKSSDDWQAILLPTLEKYARLTPGAMVEIKPFSLVWHYRQASVYHAQKYAVVLKRALKPVLKRYGLELMQGNKILEIKDPDLSKGNAIKPWLREPYDFILAIGDDTTDEDLFKELPETAFSIKVGKGLSAAQYRLPTTKHVIRLLNSLV